MNAKVLIVDDHADFRSTARLLLESEGLEVVGEAPDGKSALLAAALLKPDVILLDVNLPDLDGFAVAERICASGAAATVVLTSSRSPADFGPLVGRCGAQGFIAKDDLSGAALIAMLP